MGLEACTKDEAGFYIRVDAGKLSGLTATERFLYDLGFTRPSQTEVSQDSRLIWVSLLGNTYQRVSEPVDGCTIFDYPGQKRAIELWVHKHHLQASKPALVVEKHVPNDFYVHTLGYLNNSATRTNLVEEFALRGFTLFGTMGSLTTPDGLDIYLFVNPATRTFRELIWEEAGRRPMYAFPSNELTKVLEDNQRSQPQTFYLRLLNGHHTNANRQLVQGLLGTAGIVSLESALSVSVGSTLVFGVDVANKRYVYAGANAVYDSKTPVFDFPEKRNYIESLLKLDTLVPSRPMSTPSRKIEAHEQIFLTGSAGQLNGFIADWKEAGHEYQGVGFTSEDTNNLVAYFQTGKEPLLCKMYDGGPGLEPVTKVWTTLLERAAAHQAAIPPKLGGMEVRYMGNDGPQTVCLGDDSFPVQGLEDLAAAIVRIDGLGLPINGVSLYGVKNLVTLDELTNFNQWAEARRV